MCKEGRRKERCRVANLEKRLKDMWSEMDAFLTYNAYIAQLPVPRVSNALHILGSLCRLRISALCRQL